MKFLTGLVAAVVWVSALSPAGAQETVVISEFVASNTSDAPLSQGELLDQDGESSDWLELWNVSAATVSLAGWSLTDDLDDLGKWDFPAVELAPGEFLVVFASGKDRDDPDDELHTNFALSAGGESLALVGPDGEIVHAYVDYPAQFSDIAYGVAGTDSGLQSETVLLDETAEARAFLPTNGSLGLDWTESTFNDSAWVSGTMGVGYDYAGYIGLDVGSMRGVNQTVYVRATFSVDDVAAVDQLLLQMKYDDGFVAYLNGVEVVQANAPATTGLTWNSGATTTHDDVDAVVFEDFDISAYRHSLVEGDNVLAIHGLNSSLSSSDLLIAPKLTAVRVEEIDLAAVVEGYLLEPTPGAANQTALAQVGPAIRDVTENPPPPVPGEDLVITARVVETLAPLMAIQMTWHVGFEGDDRSLTTGVVPMADDGTEGDVTAGDGIYTAVIPGTAYDAGDMVRWCINTIDTGGRMSRNPLFLDEEDSPEFYGTMVQDSSSESSLPVLYWFTENAAATHTRSGGRASVFYNGEFYDNVFVRQRGGYTAGDSQKFVFNTGHRFRFAEEYARVREFNLNTRGSDSSYLRQPLAFETMRQAGCPASQSFLMLSVLNGEYDRVGIFIEQVDEEFLERNGLNSDGALYKFVQRSQITPVFNDISTGIEKKTREYEGYDDIAAVVAGLNAATEEERRAFVFDNFDLPEMMNYLAARCLLQDTDDIRKNFYFYRDTDGSGEWSIFPWDKDWTFGIVGDGWIYTSHPFLGADTHPKNNGAQWSVYLSVMYHLPETQEMFLRRLRTVMDAWLQPPGTALASRWFENRIDEMYLSARDRLSSSAVNSLKSYFPGRREDLYVDHSIHNTTNPPTGGCAGIPDAQPDEIAIAFGTCQATPVLGNQDEEYIELINPNDFAVDMSGWTLTGEIEYTFRPGAVIVAGGRLYVSPNVRVFRQRTFPPTGGQGLFVQGNYPGHLSNWGGTLDLCDASGGLVATLTYPGQPSTQQQYLRVTEIMYNPTSGGEFDNDDYEFIELTNIGSTPLPLLGAKLTDGIFYTFTDDSPLMLGAGARIVIVKNREAFASRYDINTVDLAPGTFTGSLSNAGETIELEDWTDSTILRFEYSDSWFDETDGLGFSLVVRNPANRSRDAWNHAEAWCPSVQEGGSPGYDGSQDRSSPL